MNITIIGTGYVGLVTGACLADLGNHVFCLDVDQTKIDLLNSGGVPIYEPGLKEVIDKSTVPVGTADKVTAAINAELDKRGINSSPVKGRPGGVFTFPVIPAKAGIQWPRKPWIPGTSPRMTTAGHGSPGQARG